MRNSIDRRTALTNLKKPTLTALIKKHEMGVGGLSKNPSKTELVEHIEATDDSRY
jgi:hypothetical protein